MTDSTSSSAGPRKTRRRPLRVAAIAGLSSVLTAIVAVLWINLTSGAHQLSKPIVSAYAVDEPGFAQAMGVLFGPPLVSGNRVTPLYNGQAIFAAMLEDIGHATKSVTFETYIYWSGAVGQRFTDALVDRAHHGVKVHLIIDAVGSGKMDASQLEAMRAGGVEVEKYQPIHWYSLDRINNRTHRKLLIVDGHVGFTGGVGIADKWDGNAEDPDHWRDSQFRVVGPVVAQLQSTFVEHWLAVRGVLLQGADYFPSLTPEGDATAQMVRSAVDDGTERIELMYLLSIASARKSVLLANSYFVPDDLSVQTLIAARERGIEVELLVPGAHIDSQVTRAASRRRWGRLLQAGIKVHEFQPTMFHCKVMVVDDLWVSVGSTNFDSRSFRLNAEANLNVLDRELARREREAFARDRARAREITLEEWRERPRLERLGDWLAGLAGSQL